MAIPGERAVSGSTLIVGRSSFFARQLAGALASDKTRQVSWREFNNPLVLDGVDTVINFSFNPRLYKDDYHPDLDVDRWLAERIEGRDIRYVLLSSRTVYAREAKWNSTEEFVTEGDGVYGRNRVQVERAVLERLGVSRTLILRLSNTIGFELQAGRRRTFMSQLLAALRDRGEIRFDMNPFSRRDFIPDIYFIRVLQTVLGRNLSGVFNVGCGFPVYTGELAMWILTGFGNGEFISESPRLNDEFYLNTRKLEAATGLSIAMSDLRDYCIEIGRRLAAAGHEADGAGE